MQLGWERPAFDFSSWNNYPASRDKIEKLSIYPNFLHPLLYFCCQAAEKGNNWFNLRDATGLKSPENGWTQCKNLLMWQFEFWISLQSSWIFEQLDFISNSRAVLGRLAGVGKVRPASHSSPRETLLITSLKKNYYLGSSFVILSPLFHWIISIKICDST